MYPSPITKQIQVGACSIVVDWPGKLNNDKRLTALTIWVHCALGNVLLYNAQVQAVINAVLPLSLT